MVLDTLTFRVTQSDLMIYAEKGKIQFIKAIRTKNNLDLKEAKEAADFIIEIYETVNSFNSNRFTERHDKLKEDCNKISIKLATLEQKNTELRIRDNEHRKWLDRITDVLQRRL